HDVVGENDEVQGHVVHIQSLVIEGHRYLGSGIGSGSGSGSGVARPRWICRRLRLPAALEVGPMQYRNLGASGLKVSTLCLGTMTFGEADEKSFMHNVGADDQTSWNILDRAVDAGVNFVDTADVYGQDGLSERVLGQWLEQSGRRDQVVVATKCRFRMSDGPL